VVGRQDSGQEQIAICKVFRLRFGGEQIRYVASEAAQGAPDRCYSLEGSARILETRDRLSRLLDRNGTTLNGKQKRDGLTP
jgi:hypothetical protein